MIILTTSAFAIFVTLNMKNVSSNYESTINKLQYNLISTLINTVEHEENSKNLPHTKEIIDTYIQNELST